MNQQQLQWYVVYTRCRWEKKVAEILTRDGISNYCPLNKVYHQWSDRKKMIMEPLFKGYVFVQILPNQQSLVWATEGVINFLYWLGKPAQIKEAEIDTIKRFLNEHETVQLRRITVSPNDKIVITNGPLMTREGNVLEVKHKTVKVLLTSFGYSLVAEVDKANIRPVNNLEVDEQGMPVRKIS